MKPTCLTDALDQSLARNGHIHYLHSQDDQSEIPFSTLKQRALGVLFHLQQKGLRAGDRCLLLTDDNAFFLDAFWACLYGGIVPVPVAVASNDETREKCLRIFDKLENGYLYTREKHLQDLLAFCADRDYRQTATRLAERHLLIESVTSTAQAGAIHPVRPEDTAFIQFSSGSTSDPKGVVLTHRNILANIEAIVEGAAITTEDRLLSWMPLTHDMGMIGFHLTAIVVGIDHSIMDTATFVRRPLLWIQSASERRATILCSPNFGYKHFLKVFEARGLQNIDLSAVRLIFNGAEPIAVDICRQFMRAMQPFSLAENAMFPVYGLAEASLAVSFPEPRATLETIDVQRKRLGIGERIVESDQDYTTFVKVGKPIRHCKVRITDLDDRPLADAHVGKIQLQGDNVTAGYYRAPEINRRLITADGWLDTGDCGAFVDGQLIITGRLKDIIFVNGLNYYSHDLETILHRDGRFEPGKVVVDGARRDRADEDEVVVFLLHRGDLDAFLPDATAARRILNHATGIEVGQVVPVKQIPKTTSGKVQRYRLTSDYLDGRFDDSLHAIERLTASATVDEPASDGGNGGNDTERHIQQICREVVTDRTIGLDDNLFEIGISSLALAEIHERLETDYPGRVEISDLFDHPTIRQLAVFLATAETA